MPIQEIYVDAAVASKVVNQAAKKVAKEAIKDTAVQMSFDMVINYKYEPQNGKKPKEGFEMICLPRNRSGSDCSKPMEMKKMTSVDKQVLSKKVEETLDKKIAGGIGATRWGKFLDWFVPVFAVGFGYAIIDYAINGDVSDLFDDIAFDSLVETGFLVNDNDVDQINLNPDLEVFAAIGKDLFVIKIGLKDRKDIGAYKVKFSDGSMRDLSVVSSGVSLHGSGVKYNKDTEVMTISGYNVFANGLPLDNSKSIVSLPDIKLNEDVSISKASGLVAIFGLEKYIDKNIYRDVEPMPEWDQLDLPRTNREGKQIPMVAPGALPMEDLQTGQTVIPHPQPDGTIDYRTETGRKVDEDDILVKDPEIKQNANGSSTVIKQPTGSNPKPDDSENGTLPPDPTDPNEPGQEIPPGDSCDVELQLPRFGALFRSLSDTFPFSIPWDLKSGFDAIFTEMGSERPEWTFELSGEKIKIEIPKMIDDWMPFLHSLLLIIFDIGILYAIYRLIQGGGS